MDLNHPVILDPQRVPYMKAYRLANRKKINAQMKEYYATHPEARFKRSARKKVDTEVRAGRMIRLPCVVCRNPEVQAHHEDYSKPLEVTWFCKDHHTTHERITRICSKT
jgi:hypothetical protein